MPSLTQQWLLVPGHGLPLRLLGRGPGGRRAWRPGKARCAPASASPGV